MSVDPWPNEPSYIFKNIKNNSKNNEKSEYQDKPSDLGYTILHTASETTT